MIILIMMIMIITIIFLNQRGYVTRILPFQIINLTYEYSRFSLLLAAIQGRSSWRNAPNGEQQGETAVFAGYHQFCASIQFNSILFTLL